MTVTGPQAEEPAGPDQDAGPGGEDLPLLAYQLEPEPRVELTAAAVRRDWMDATDQRYANRCLPLLMANQAGWLLLSKDTFTVEWSGAREQSATQVRPGDGTGAVPAMSHFGHGILTFHLPYLFRTPPGWNLLVRGPANRPKDGIAPLEGLVEADWASSTFTMNWQITRPGTPIEFTRGEPICMIVPQRRAELERFRPAISDLAAMPDMREYLSWRQRRADFISDLSVPDSDAAQAGWQRDYMIGAEPDGTVFRDHQRKLRLRDWEVLPGSQRRCG